MEFRGLQQPESPAFAHEDMTACRTLPFTRLKDPTAKCPIDTLSWAIAGNDGNRDAGSE